MKTVISFLIMLLFPVSLISQESYPKREVRAVWLTTIYGLDWPSRTAADVVGQERQKVELIRILDKLRAANFNTIFIQTRLRGDVIYRSQIEAMSKVFTGYYGEWPSYDPLAFVIDECHKRGMECHAFIVTYPVGSVKVVQEQGNWSIVRRRPDLCLQHLGEWYLDPGRPGTTEYILNIVEELIRGYDLDGIQFDYLRYPERANSFPDDQTFALYGVNQEKSAWRRNNINRFMSAAYDLIKREKPWIQVSSSPLGKYSRNERTPKAGWTAYDDVYQDPRAWFQQGKHDLVAPMMYYVRDDFYPHVDVWQQNAGDRGVIAGLGAYRLNRLEGDWSVTEIEDQIRYLRGRGVSGLSFFRTKHVIENEKGLYDVLRNRYFRYPAQLPALSWLGRGAPLSPREVNVRREDGYLHITWQDSLSGRGNTYTVYCTSQDRLNTSWAQSICRTGLRETELYIPLSSGVEGSYLICVTSSNRYHMESRPSEEAFYYHSEYEK